MAGSVRADVTFGFHLQATTGFTSKTTAFLFGGFKYEVQHGLMRRKTPRGVS